MSPSPGQQPRHALQVAEDRYRLLPFVGVYDLFSASLAADRFNSVLEAKLKRAGGA